METETEYQDPLEIKVEVDQASPTMEIKTEFDMTLTNNAIQSVHHNSEELILPNSYSSLKDESEPEEDPLATDSEDILVNPDNITESGSEAANEAFEPRQDKTDDDDDMETLSRSKSLHSRKRKTKSSPRLPRKTRQRTPSVPPTTHYARDEDEVASVPTPLRVQSILTANGYSNLVKCMLQVISSELIEEGKDPSPVNFDQALDENLAELRNNRKQHESDIRWFSRYFETREQYLTTNSSFATDFDASKEYRCLLCPTQKSYNSSSRFNDHIMYQHLMVFPRYHCPVQHCTSVAKYSPDIKKHLLTAHKKSKHDSEKLTDTKYTRGMGLYDKTFDRTKIHTTKAIRGIPTIADEQYPPTVDESHLTH